MEKKNKTAIVTGGTKGIGIKIVKKYLSEGEKDKIDNIKSLI